jgi:hypothetical protein
MSSNDSTTKYNPEDIIKKVARGLDDCHLGEIKILVMIM